MSFFRLAARKTPVSFIRAQPRLAVAARPVQVCSNFSTTSIRRAEDHHEESFEEFTARYEKEFDSVQDVFELQRNLNNAFAYDLVPSPSVISAALRAARRVNDFPTAVRIFEGIKSKVENKGQYEEYLSDLQPLREELGVNLKEDLYPESQ
ncbi:COX5A-domain-containing protein [Xylona heveae TC161]|uniref:Cytochrome c oxidase subunit 6, mitochondrial n=1 Tax=Xylona heveae (strain CBS 132557 / TC161) TaxID=1328760 RepID=A0A165AF12_XYLHT|nr:COX5A-domain-containing protein [Xylona heveae TC161]KZF20370.1 COX5A-domain-containing protein [Xylona heveae TC161]